MKFYFDKYLTKSVLQVSIAALIGMFNFFYNKYDKVNTDINYYKESLFIEKKEIEFEYNQYKSYLNLIDTIYNNMTNRVNSIDYNSNIKNILIDMSKNNAYNIFSDQQTQNYFNSVDKLLVTDLKLNRLKKNNEYDSINYYEDQMFLYMNTLDYISRNEFCNKCNIIFNRNNDDVIYLKLENLFNDRKIYKLLFIASLFITIILTIVFFSKNYYKD